MPVFGKKSFAELQTLDQDLQRIVRIAILYVDFSILTGQRNEARQNELFATGASKVEFPNSKHNRFPSHAFDFAPYPIDWGGRPEDMKKMAEKRFYLYAGLFRGLGLGLGIQLRTGADWDGDGEIEDQTFHDLGHVELMS